MDVYAIVRNDKHGKNRELKLTTTNSHSTAKQYRKSKKNELKTSKKQNKL